MAIEYVSELGDKLSNNSTAANLPQHIKVISAPNYRRTDNGVVTNPSLQTALDGKADKVSGATAGDVATLDANGNLVDSGKTLGTSVPANAVFTDTDTKVTSATNHYTPSRDTSADKSASASGATSAWGIDVVKGVTLQTDGKGHITGITVTSGKVPSAVATTSAKGLMSSTDKTKLDGLEFMSDTENDTMITNIISSAH